MPDYVREEGYADEPMEQSPLRRVLSELDRTANGLDKAVAGLAERLGPLRVERPQKDDRGPESQRAAGSEVVQVIVDVTDRLRSIERRVETLVVELEV